MFDWRGLPWLSEDELARKDVAETNLACADGLPGIEQYELSNLLYRLDWWTRAVRQYTERVLPLFRRKRYDYRNSEAYFRTMAMVTALQRDLGLRYNPHRVVDDTPFEPADTYIHGAILGQGGTCSSIPVVLAAVGRRLGYPIKIVQCLGERWAHLFARWEEPGRERFNIEAANLGMSSFPDDYYREGIYARTRECENAGCLLKSMTPREELANFLAERACHWRDQANHRATVESFAHAAALCPANGFYVNSLKIALNAWYRDQETTKPPGFPDMYVNRKGSRFPPGLPIDLQRSILGKEATDNALRDPDLERRFWGPMRRGEKPEHVPLRLDATTYDKGRCELRLSFTACNVTHRP